MGKSYPQPLDTYSRRMSGKPLSPYRPGPARPIVRHRLGPEDRRPGVPPRRPPGRRLTPGRTLQVVPTRTLVHATRMHVPPAPRQGPGAISCTDRISCCCRNAGARPVGCKAQRKCQQVPQRNCQQAQPKCQQPRGYGTQPNVPWNEQPKVQQTPLKVHWPERASQGGDRRLGRVAWCHGRPPNRAAAPRAQAHGRPRARKREIRSGTPADRPRGHDAGARAPVRATAALGRSALGRYGARPARGASSGRWLRRRRPSPSGTGLGRSRLAKVPARARGRQGRPSAVTTVVAPALTRGLATATSRGSKPPRRTVAVAKAAASMSCRRRSLCAVAGVNLGGEADGGGAGRFRSSQGPKCSAPHLGPRPWPRGLAGSCATTPRSSQGSFANGSGLTSRRNRPSVAARPNSQRSASTPWTWWARSTVSSLACSARSHALTNWAPVASPRSEERLQCLPRAMRTSACSRAMPPWLGLAWTTKRPARRHAAPALLATSALSYGSTTNATRPGRQRRDRAPWRRSRWQSRCCMAVSGALWCASAARARPAHRGPAPSPGQAPRQPCSAKVLRATSSLRRSLPCSAHNLAAV